MHLSPVSCPSTRTAFILISTPVAKAFPNSGSSCASRTLEQE